MRRHIKPEKHLLETTKEQILEAALKVFARYGFDGTTVRMICKEADVSVALINYHWGGKENLWREVCSLCADRIHAKMISAADFSVPPREGVPAFIGALFDSLAADVDLLRITMWATLEAETIDYEKTRFEFQPLIDFGSSYLQRLVDDGSIPAIDLKLALMAIRAQFIFMLVDRHGQLHAFGRDLSDRRQAARVRKSFINNAIAILGLE